MKSAYAGSRKVKGEYQACSLANPVDAVRKPTGPADGNWHLFDFQSERAENNDVSAQNPPIIDSLVQQWNSYMSSVGGVEPLRPRGYY